MKVISIADYNSTITNEGLEATEEGVETQSKELSPTSGICNIARCAT